MTAVPSPKRAESDIFGAIRNKYAPITVDANRLVLRGYEASASTQSTGYNHPTGLGSLRQFVIGSGANMFYV